MLHERLGRLISYSLIILAVLVQLQTTIELGASEVRANAADIALAAFSPFILYSLFSNRVRLRQIAGLQLLALLVAATLILTLSLFRSFEFIAGLSSWAAIKYAGWYILLYYLALGALIATLSLPAANERFFLGLVGFQVVLVFAYIAIEYAGFSWVSLVGGALTGFAGNPNAMAFYFICGFAMALVYIGQTGLSPRRRISVLVAAGTLVAGILFTKSIAALIALVTVMLFAAIIRKVTLKHLAQVLALGVTFWMAPQFSTVPSIPSLNITHKLSKIAQESTASLQDYPNRYAATVTARMDGYREALAMWKEHPVFGAGLGVHLHRQSLDEKPVILVLQIHNTALWLLAETGLAGFLAMAGIFVVLFHKVWRLSRAPPEEPDTQIWFQSAVLLIMVGWGVMSLFHEFMYQRVFWLFVGMALSMPVELLRFWKRNSASQK